MKPLVKNASNEDQINSAKTKVKLGRDRELDDLRFILSTDQGRRFVWKMLSRCGVFKISFTGSSQTFFNEGERSIGLYLLNEVMDADPDSYVKMYVKDKKESEGF